MAESVVTQVKEAPKAVVGTLRNSPVKAIGVGFLVLTLVLLIEAWKPGIITSPIRRMLRAIGVKTA